ncbi:MAG: hypothetical protein JWL60_1053 [Gemmatimonadetes bacterium]|nr:hypothetical protein [Gemmatimonadota bacterium]
MALRRRRRERATRPVALSARTASGCTDAAQAQSGSLECDGTAGSVACMRTPPCSAVAMIDVAGRIAWRHDGAHAVQASRRHGWCGAVHSPRTSSMHPQPRAAKTVGSPEEFRLSPANRKSGPHLRRLDASRRSSSGRCTVRSERSGVHASVATTVSPHVAPVVPGLGPRTAAAMHAGRCSEWKSCVAPCTGARRGGVGWDGLERGGCRATCRSGERWPRRFEYPGLVHIRGGDTRCPRARN